MRKQTPGRVLVAGSVVVLLVLSSCKEQGAGIETPLASVSGPQDPDLRVNPAGYHDRHFSGPVYIPRSSPMENGTTAYDVTYQDGVTVISKDETMRHLVNIDQDGSYRFDSSANQIAKLQPGTVLLLSGLALCTVVDVQKTPSGYSLKTGPAKITDAIKNGRLEGVYKIDFSRMRTAKSSSLQEGLPFRSSFFGVVYAGGADTAEAQGVADFDVDFSGYNYHVKFTPGNDRIDIQATIKFGGSQGTLAYEGIGYLSNFVSIIKMRIKDGQLTTLGFTNSNLDGHAELKWYAAANDDDDLGGRGQSHFLAGRAFKERAALQSGLSCPDPGRSGPLRFENFPGLQFHSSFHFEEQRRGGQQAHQVQWKWRIPTRERRNKAVGVDQRTGRCC